MMRTLSLMIVLSSAAPSADAASCPSAPLPPIYGAASTAGRSREPHPDLAIASLNIAGKAGIRDEVIAWTKQRALDVLLLQEVGSLSLDGAAFSADVSTRLGFHFAYAAADRLDRGQTQGLAIVSRYPLEDIRVDALARHQLHFRSRCRIALLATVRTADGPVRAVNVHLDTRINSKDRIDQLTPVIEALQHDPRPQIVAGDFNTMRAAWFGSMWPIPYGQNQANAIRDFLIRDGFHTPFIDTPPTFKILGVPYSQLDWIYLKGLNATDKHVDAVRLSDHRGIWTRVQSISVGHTH